MVTALTADELKRAGVAAFQLAPLDAGRLAPQAGRIAVAGLTGKRECHDTLVDSARLGVTRIARAARYQNVIRTVSQANIDYSVQVCASHSIPQGQPYIPLPGSGAARPIEYHSTSVLSQMLP